jgi:hypothetical protein
MSIKACHVAGDSSRQTSKASFRLLNISVSLPQSIAVKSEHPIDFAHGKTIEI